MKVGDWRGSWSVLRRFSTTRMSGLEGVLAGRVSLAGKSQVGVVVCWGCVGWREPALTMVR
jgi:hypothetical protein